MNANDQQLRKALDMARRTLAILEEQAAGYGSLEIPVSLRVQLEDKRCEVTELAQVCLDAEMAEDRVQRDNAEQQYRARRAHQKVVNLRPLNMTHTFKDRARELDACLKHLGHDSVRVICILGRSGMGKTALASKILADLESGVLPVPEAERTLSVDGIIYLSARSTGLGLERIYSDVGRMLGGATAQRLNHVWADRETPLTAKVEYLLEAMQSGFYLLLLDNLEDKLDAQGNLDDPGLQLFIERCLSQPGGIRLLITSREQVNLPPAGLAAARSIPLYDGLPLVDAAALLRELDPQGELGLHDAPESELQRASQLTRGIPRALELLVGILHTDRNITLEELLDDQTLLEERVVETLLAAGYTRLNEHERRVLEALAVYNRPITETAVTFLLHPWYPGLEIHSLLRRLLNRYLVSYNRLTREYYLHPLDREYAYAQIPETNRAATDQPNFTRNQLELRAAAYYAALRKPQNAWLSMRDLTPQLAEFEHYLRGGQPQDAFALLELIDQDYLSLWGYYPQLAEMRERLARVLQEPAQQITNLGQLGLAYYALGRFQQAVTAIQQVIDALPELNQAAQEATWLNQLARAYRGLGQVDAAFACDQRAVAVAERTGNRYERMVALGHIGVIHRDQGNEEQAFSYLEQALHLAQELGAQKEAGILHGRLGLLNRDLGYVDRALEAHRIALELAQKVQFRRYVGTWAGVMGGDYYLLGQFNRSKLYHNQALAIMRELGVRNEESTQLGFIGGNYYCLGDTETALAHHQQALEIAKQTGDNRNTALWLNCLGIDYCAQGRLDQALPYHTEAVRIGKEHRNLRGTSYALLSLGRTQLIKGNIAAAEAALREVKALGFPWLKYLSEPLLSIVGLCQKVVTTDILIATIQECRARLGREPRLYQTRYVLAIGLLLSTVQDSRWKIPKHREALLMPVLEMYQQALNVTAARGVIAENLQDLELIRAAGIEGLEPVFELLQNAEYIPDTPEDSDKLLASLAIPEA